MNSSLILPTTSSAINAVLLRRNVQASWNLLSTGVAIGNVFGEFSSESVIAFEYDFTTACDPGWKFASVVPGNFLGITNLLARPSASSITL